MNKFLAIKRVGSVLRSDEALTWFDATEVLKLLEGADGDRIDEMLRTQVRSFFHYPDAKFVVERTDASSLPPYSDRGQIFHSAKIAVPFAGFDLLLGISFTVCVRIDLPLLDHSPPISQSKLWCSAIITSDSLEQVSGVDSDDFAKVCAEIEAFAGIVREHICPLYGETVRKVSPEAGAITPTEDIFSNVVLQIDDREFREDLRSLTAKELKLSQMRSGSVLGLMNRLYSGSGATTYVHAHRSAFEGGCAPENISIDTIVQTDRMCAQALWIETRDTSGQASNWRHLGATSESEPVRMDPARAHEPIYRLIHSPANILSAELAAEIGEQF